MRFLVCVLALALLAGIVTGREQSSVPEAPPRAAAPTPPPVSPLQDLKVDKLLRKRNEQDIEDVFATQSWTPAASAGPSVAAEPSPPPQAAAPVTPPLPFTYLGRMVRNETTLVYLVKGEDMLLVESGQTLGDYRVETIGESAMSFSHAPSGARQTLSFPGRE